MGYSFPATNQVACPFGSAPSIGDNGERAQTFMAGSDFFWLSRAYACTRDSSDISMPAGVAEIGRQLFAGLRKIGAVSAAILSGS
jgi:hypothetical protein